MKVTMVADNRMAIMFTGVASKVQSAFATTLATYKVASRTDNGALKFFSYTSSPKVPSTFASSVVAIDGLQSAYAPSKRSTLSPAQTRTLYNAAATYSTYKGENVNIGITNYDGYRLSNLPLFYSSFGLPTPALGVGSNVQQISVNGGNGNLDDPAGEGDLDIQLALATAPLCNLLIYDAGNISSNGASYITGYLGPLVREAQDNVADIISESYGYPTREATRGIIQSAHDQHVAMTLQGITYALASGDYGTDLLGNDYPNFDPEILLVGGTVATVDAVGNRIAEDGWNGSGAGYSTFDIAFNRLPLYQVGSGVPTNINRRLFPDVALHADSQNLPTGQFGFSAYNIVFGGALSAASGTSASAPTFAGLLGTSLQSLAAQNAADLASNGRPRLGRINDLVYALDGDPSAFTDILTGDAGVLPNGQEAVGRPGWDFVTGFGAPDMQGLTAAFLANSSESIFDSAGSVNVYTLPRPVITLGTDPRGNAGSLSDSDGVLYSLQSVRQSGLGQTVAATIMTPLQTIRDRRGASVRVVMSIPTRTTGYVYLLNNNTGGYDLVKTITGTGPENATNASLKPVDVTFDASPTSPYVVGDSVTMLVRAIKPSRFGNSPFRMTLDQAGIVERVAR